MAPESLPRASESEREHSRDGEDRQTTRIPYDADLSDEEKAQMAKWLIEALGLGYDFVCFQPKPVERPRKIMIVATRTDSSNILRVLLDEEEPSR